MRFTKMHGAGNDYVYVDCTVNMISNPEKLAVTVSNRNFGVGSDGLVLICPSEVADFRMRMFNSDGSEAQMCGNASRCIGKYVYEKGLTKKESISLETLAGIKHLDLLVKNGIVKTITVDMGIPELKPEKIPVKTESSNTFINNAVEIDGIIYRITCVSMGNPHAVIFVEDVEHTNVQLIGKMIENHPMFPEKTNVEFVEHLTEGNFKMRVWERGAGETLACGTGACATLVAAILNGYAGREAIVSLPGGDLKIRWDAASEHVYMTGNAKTVFEGELLI